MSPEAEALHRLEAAVVDAAAHKLAEAILARPQFGDVVVKAIVDEIGRCARQTVEPMVARILVERAGDTFRSVDEAIELVRKETLNSARQRVAENLPKQEDIRRESLAIVREAVVRALEPTVARIAGEVASELGSTAAEVKANADGPRLLFDRARAQASVPIGPAPGPQPGDPGGRCIAAAGGACRCDNCLPF